LADALDVAGSNRAGEEAVVADAAEAAGQDVQEEDRLAPWFMRAPLRGGRAFL